MQNTFPFSFLESFAARFQPPAWAVDEAQQRLVLFLNHVLMQEKQAQDRLLRQKGRVVRVLLGVFSLDLVVTPAGLVDRGAATSKPDLVLSLVSEPPLTMVRSALSGKPPPVKIEGDVQFAADVGWLAENLRWDVEEDLSRVMGDAPAHALVDGARQLLAGLKRFLAAQPFAAPESSVVVPAGASGVPQTQAADAAPASKAAE